MGKNDIYKQERNKAIILGQFRRQVQDMLEPHMDDQFLQRWLIARDYDLVKAEKMIREHFVFRKRIGVSTILQDFKIPEVVQKYSITTSLGYDKSNSPVRIFMIGVGDFRGFINSLNMLEIMKIFVYYLEYDLNMIQEKKKETKNYCPKATYIIDYTNFSLKKFYTKQIMTVGLQLLAMYQDNYPETLKVAYLTNAPSYYSFIFNVFKPFLNAVTINKLKVLPTAEWKAELRKIMDPEQMPAFLGGEMTSPDGDPKCPHLFNWNSNIDPSNYRKNNKRSSLIDSSLNDSTFTTATVHQRAVLQVPVEVPTSGLLLRWAFSTRENNIRFGIFLRTSGSRSLEEIVPVESVNAHLEKEENELVCQKTGTYLLHFDNSYSWLTSKQVSYKVEVEKIVTVECKNL